MVRSSSPGAVPVDSLSHGFSAGDRGTPRQICSTDCGVREPSRAGVGAISRAAQGDSRTLPCATMSVWDKEMRPWFCR